MSHTKALADSAKFVLFVCSLTHFTAGLEQMDRYDRGPAIIVSTHAISLQYHTRPAVTMVFPVSLQTYGVLVSIY
jgi:hypothetical protein